MDKGEMEGGRLGEESSPENKDVRRVKGREKEKNWKRHG